MHLELTEAPAGFGVRRRRTILIRVQGPRVPGLQIRATRRTDLRAGVEVGLGRLDEHVRVTATDPADAVSRFTPAARAACLRATALGATFDDGTWTLSTDATSEHAARLLRPVLAAAEGIDSLGSIHGRLEHNAFHDPILEVRVVNAVHRLSHGPSDDETVRRLAAALVEGCEATPPVALATQAMARLRTRRAQLEVGRVSVASDAGGEMTLADGPGGQLSLDHDGGPSVMESSAKRLLHSRTPGPADGSIKR